MQQYTFTIPENLQAKELLNYILRTNIFHVESVKEIKAEKYKEQKKMLANDMLETFTEIAEMKQVIKAKKR